MKFGIEIEGSDGCYCFKQIEAKAFSEAVHKAAKLLQEIVPHKSQDLRITSVYEVEE